MYQQAKLRAQRETGTFYLEWINKKSLKNLSRLVVRPHRDAVYHACFSRDRQRIASCGADKTLQVFKAESGERLLEISAHDDEILCCTFSADDKYVATCSADKKVKIWNSRTGKCLYVYEEHTEQVNCCQFNNRRGQYLLATCSDDTYIKVSRKDCDKQYGNNQNRVIIVVEIRFKPCKLRFIMSLVEERQKQIMNTDRAEQKECLYLQ